MSRRVLLAAVAAVAAGAGAAGALALRDRGEDRQASVAQRGARVMPFDLDRTTHVFRPTATGGVQTVVADDRGDEEQIGLIREHLRAESARFRRGDFSDPAAIHGSSMPGLATLRARAADIGIRYEEVPAGARIRYTAPDQTVLHALHVWFSAQVADHGAHATHASG